VRVVLVGAPCNVSPAWWHVSTQGNTMQPTFSPFWTLRVQNECLQFGRWCAHCHSRKRWIPRADESFWIHSVPSEDCMRPCCNQLSSRRRAVRQDALRCEQGSGAGDLCKMMQHATKTCRNNWLFFEWISPSQLQTAQLHTTTAVHPCNLMFQLTKCLQIWQMSETKWLSIGWWHKELTMQLIGIEWQNEAPNATLTFKIDQTKTMEQLGSRLSDEKSCGTRRRQGWMKWNNCGTRGQEQMTSSNGVNSRWGWMWFLAVLHKKNISTPESATNVQQSNADCQCSVFQMDVVLQGMFCNWPLCDCCFKKMVEIARRNTKIWDLSFECARDMMPHWC